MKGPGAWTPGLVPNAAPSLGSPLRAEDPRVLPARGDSGWGPGCKAFCPTHSRGKSFWFFHLGATLPWPALCPQSSRHSKLEKADILEMTVKHLRSLQRAQMTAALSTDPTVLGKYRAGFSECMNEVTRFLSTCEGVNTEVRTRLLGHLASCMTQINAMNYPAPPPPPPLPPAAPGADAAKVYGGFQLLPASDGQFAFLIPSSAFGPGGAVLPLYGGPATAASPPGPPPGTADSVWRPW
uniref:Hes family bHLH transcription factor 1 n=1 Tax=Nothoprocta perdicaria TaxID=30464 RepID=A0A8C6Z273_NOTPE